MTPTLTEAQKDHLAIHDEDCTRCRRRIQAVWTEDGFAHGLGYEACA